MDLRINKLTKGYTFQGELDGEILAEILKRLDLPSDYEYCVRIEGDYSVDWDDECAYPQVDTIYAVNPNDDTIFTDISELVDLDQVNEQLDKFTDDHYGDWAEDRAGSLADRAYDDYVDRMMDEAND